MQILMENTDKEINILNSSEGDVSEEKTLSETKIGDTDDAKSENNINVAEAGPSGCEELPGSITPCINKQGISRSEVNIRKIFANNEVPNTITLTSLSFGPNPQNIYEIRDEDVSLQKNFIDMKKFIASCFKFNKESNHVVDINNVPIVTEVPVNFVNRPVIVEGVQETYNPNCLTNNTQTEPVVEVSNEIVIANFNPSESKTSKVTPDSKSKTSGNISERSEIHVTQRDSLSSIGSNVCRICMTRGKERLDQNQVFLYLKVFCIEVVFLSIFMTFITIGFWYIITNF